MVDFEDLENDEARHLRDAVAALVAGYKSRFSDCMQTVGGEHGGGMGLWHAFAMFADSGADDVDPGHERLLFDSLQVSLPGSRGARVHLVAFARQAQMMASTGEYGQMAHLTCSVYWELSAPLQKVRETQLWGGVGHESDHWVRAVEASEAFRVPMACVEPIRVEWDAGTI